MIRLNVLFVAALASPAFAASGPFFSLGNTDFVVAVSFVIFVGAIIYFKAPQFAAKLIDGQISEIRNQIDRATDIRADAETSLSEARAEAEAAESQAKKITEYASAASQRQIENAQNAIKETGERRIQAAIEQIATAEKAAQSAIYNEAIDMALDVAAKEIASKLSASENDRVTKRAIEEIRDHMH